MATDPICGMHVDEKNTKLTSLRDGRKYYFCSNTCRLQFERPEKEMHDLELSLKVSWPITLAVLLLTYVLTVRYGNYMMLVLATAVQFYSGSRFYKGTIDAIKNRSANMDTLIAIGTSAAWAYSTVLVFIPSAFPSSNLYFDTSTVIISLILTGTYMQRLAERRATKSVEKLVALQPKTAHIIHGSNITEIPAEQIKVNDMLLVRPGERIPTDSVVVKGASYVDESMISGESAPAGKKAGDEAIGGTINKTGALTIRAIKVGKDTALAQIIQIVQSAISNKVPIQKLVDRISSYFVPMVVAIGIVSSLSWHFLFGVNASTSLLIFVSVLIIACPCALGIATPAALLVSSGLAARRGILIKNGQSIEMAEKIDTVILDKTGTLTEGKPRITDLVTFGISKRKLLSYAAQAEFNSEHIIGKIIVEEARRQRVNARQPKTFVYKVGSGVVATDEKKTRIIVGNRKLFSKMDKGMENRLRELEGEGKTVVIVGINGRISGLIAISDRIRADSGKAIELFIQMRIEPFMLTGDNERIAKAVARSVGISNVMASMAPKAKMDKLEELQRNGKRVAMIGDGVNDAPALAKADLGIAIGSGTDVAIETGDIILIKSKVSDAAAAIRIGRKTMSKIRQNLFWAFGYNIVLIPVAAGVLIPLYGIGIYNSLPFLAAFAMAFSSVTVVFNSLLLNDFKPTLG